MGLGDPCPEGCLLWIEESMLWDWGRTSRGYGESTLRDWGLGDVCHEIGAGSGGCTSWGHKEPMLWVSLGGKCIMGGLCHGVMGNPCCGFGVSVGCLP